MKLSKYYSYIIIGVLFPVFLCLIVVGERRNKRPVENINVSQANPEIEKLTTTKTPSDMPLINVGEKLLEAGAARQPGDLKEAIDAILAGDELKGNKFYDILEKGKDSYKPEDLTRLEKSIDVHSAYMHKSGKLGGASVQVQSKGIEIIEFPKKRDLVKMSPSEIEDIVATPDYQKRLELAEKTAKERTARRDALDENIDKYDPFDVVIDSNEKVRLQRAAAFLQFLFSEYGKGDRVITRTAKTPGYQWERIGFRGLEWGTDVSQIDDLVLFPSDETEIIRLDETEIRFDAVGRRRGDETKINVPLVIDSRLIGRFLMHGETIYIFYKNKLVGASIIMGGFPVYDKMPYCIDDMLGPPSYTSSDGMLVWDGNVTDISLTFERSEFKGEMMHSYTINFTKSDDPR